MNTSPPPLLPADGTPSAVSRKRRLREGFSLIEVLVATTLLVIIVIMVGMVFRQSSLSWQSGMSRADGNMLVRSVVGAVERELRLAVDARQYGYPQAMTVAPSRLEFVALLNTSGGQREPTHIVLTGGSTVTRTATRLTASGTPPVWAPTGAPEVSTLLHSTAAEVQPSLVFAHDSNGAQLPNWVNLQVSMVPSAGFQGIRTISMGRDRQENTGDDIEVR